MYVNVNYVVNIRRIIVVDLFAYGAYDEFHALGILNYRGLITPHVENQVSPFGIFFYYCYRCHVHTLT